MRIAFFGLPLAALLLKRDGHTIVHAAICRPDAIGKRRLTRELGADKVDLKPNVEAATFEKKLRKAKPDLVVSWFWTTRLPMRLVSIAPLGGFGVHPSLLPKHRGPDPYFWAIDSADTVTGVTAHRLAEEYDTGAILGQRMLRIDPSWNAWTLARRLDRPSLALLREIVNAFARGTPPSDIPQDDAKATLAPTPEDDLLEIDWTQSSDRIERRILAASPYPGAYTFLGEEPVTITAVAPARAFPKSLAPGEAAVVGTGASARAIIRTGDGALELLEGRGEGSEGDDYALDRETFCELIDALRSGK